ncbi:hypothetical protein EVAR_88269_1 [Eumeta japonica]|uniref:Uncharacterized protein n=1 Tax=Eumeta variegata TaxID=151549 RepID=A0A4C1XK58_EUMVA|nr:hypothetical protein EVAR_88269_1 [Eumeta japonica]
MKIRKYFKQCNAHRVGVAGDSVPGTRSSANCFYTAPHGAPSEIEVISQFRRSGQVTERRGGRGVRRGPGALQNGSVLRASRPGRWRVCAEFIFGGTGANIAGVASFTSRLERQRPWGRLEPRVLQKSAHPRYCDSAQTVGRKSCKSEQREKLFECKQSRDFVQRCDRDAATGRRARAPIINHRRRSRRSPGAARRHKRARLIRPPARRRSHKPARPSSIYSSAGAGRPPGVRD